MRTFKTYAESRLIDDFLYILEATTPGGLWVPDGTDTSQVQPQAPQAAQSPIVTPEPIGGEEKAQASTSDQEITQHVQSAMGKIGQTVDKVLMMIKRSMKAGTAKYVPGSTVAAGQTMQQADQSPNVAGAMAAADTGQSMAGRLAAHSDLLASNKELRQIVEKLEIIEAALPPKKGSMNQVFAQLKQIIMKEIETLVGVLKQKLGKGAKPSGQEEIEALKKQRLYNPKQPPPLPATGPVKQQTLPGM